MKDYFRYHLEQWWYIILLILFLTMFAYPQFGEDLMDMLGDRAPTSTRLYGPILQGQEPYFLEIEGFLRDDALSRNSADSDFSEWYYPIITTSPYNNKQVVAGLTRHDGSAIESETLVPALLQIWNHYGKFTSICIYPQQSIFSFEDGLNNLVYSIEGVHPTYLLSEDEPIEFSVTRISKHWYRFRPTDVRD